MAGTARAAPIVFAPGDYDNTANTVTAGPTTHNNQTTGSFRDIFWYDINNGAPRVPDNGHPNPRDYINSGKSLKLVNNHAVDDGTGLYTSLNFTGPSISGGQSYLTVFDSDANGPQTDLFDATGGMTISADFMFVKHNVSAGLVALYGDGQDGLALLATNRDGNNTDNYKLSLIWQSPGSGIELTSVTIPATSFVPQDWYRITMNLSVLNDTWTLDGTFQDHLTPTDPNSALNNTIATLSATSGSVSDPDASNRVLTNPGQIGIMAMGNESISLPDNVGVSVTNFSIPQQGGCIGCGTQSVPEPGTLALFGVGLAGLGFWRRRRGRG